MVPSLFTSERRLVSFVGWPSWLLTIGKSLESTTRLPSTSPSKRPIVTQAVATLLPASSFTSFAVTVMFEALHETPVRLMVSVLPVIEVLATRPQLELARANETILLVKVISTVKFPPGFPERSSTPDSPVSGKSIGQIESLEDATEIISSKQLNPPGQPPITPMEKSPFIGFHTSLYSGLLEKALKLFPHGEPTHSAPAVALMRASLKYPSLLSVPIGVTFSQ